MGKLQGQHFLVHLDKPFYISGDIIRYKIYDSNSPKGSPVLLYIELLNQNHSRISSQVVSLDSTGAGGSIDLPVDLMEGVYLLQYYRVWDARNNDTKKVQGGGQYILILNDLETETEDPKFDVQDQSLKNLPPVETTLPARSKISLPLSVQDPGVSSASVSIMQYFPDEPEWVSTFQSNSSEFSIPDEKNFYPRTRLVLEGKVMDSKKNTPVTEKYLSFYLPRLGLFKRFNARNGNFKIELPEFYGTADYQILSLNPNRSYPMSVVPLESNLPAHNQPFPEVPNVSAGIRQYLKQNYKRRLVNDLFHIRPPAIERVVDSVKQFIPDRQYLMKDFQQLNSIQDFIKEVLLDSRITSLINDKKSLRMRNKETNELYHWPSWYMMNGFFAGHENEILQMDLSKIKSIELYQRNKTITDQLDSMMVYTGLFALQTAPMRDLSEKYGVLKFQVKGFEENQPWSFNPIEEKRTPDLRSFLYWNPQVPIDPNGKVVLDFYTSDIQGVFEIKLVGLDNSKKPVVKRWWIKVE